MLLRIFSAYVSRFCFNKVKFKQIYIEYLWKQTNMREKKKKKKKMPWSTYGITWNSFRKTKTHAQQIQNERERKIKKNGRKKEFFTVSNLVKEWRYRKLLQMERNGCEKLGQWLCKVQMYIEHSHSLLFLLFSSFENVTFQSLFFSIFFFFFLSLHIVKWNLPFIVSSHFMYMCKFFFISTSFFLWGKHMKNFCTRCWTNCTSNTCRSIHKFLWLALDEIFRFGFVCSKWKEGKDGKDGKRRWLFTTIEQCAFWLTVNYGNFYLVCVFGVI